MSPTALSPVEATGAAIGVELRRTVPPIARKPGDATAKALVPSPPPLWIDPEDGVPAPASKQGTEDDVATVLGLVYAGELTARPYSGTRQLTWDFWIRCKGDRPARRAADYDARIRALLFDRRATILANAQPEQLLVHSIDQWRGLQKLEATVAQGHTYIVSYLLTVYA